MSNKEG